MRDVIKRAVSAFARDVRAGQSPARLASKALRYTYELGAAQLWLRNVSRVGRGVRALHRPNIENDGYLAIGDNTLLRSLNVPVELACGPGAKLSIGADCFINYGVSIGCTEAITIGDRCRIGPYVMIVDTNFHDLYDRALRPMPKAVLIENDVWLGAKATVLPGVTIGRGAVVGTGAVVTHDVSPFSVVAGVPAKVVKVLDPTKFVVREGEHPAAGTVESG